jgi:hypothetical protein
VGNARHLRSSASSDGYPQDGLGFSYNRGKLQIDFSGAPLRQVQNPVAQDRYRYTTSHRFALRLNPSLMIAFWETGIVSTESKNVATTIASPFYPLVLKGLFGGSDDANTIIGADLSWRLGHPLPAASPVRARRSGLRQCGGRASGALGRDARPRRPARDSRSAGARG